MYLVFKEIVLIKTNLIQAVNYVEASFTLIKHTQLPNGDHSTPDQDSCHLKSEKMTDPPVFKSASISLLCDKFSLDIYIASSYLIFYKYL